MIYLKYRRYLLAILLFITVCTAYGQVEFIETHQSRSSFQNTSYLVTNDNASLTLKNGFHASYNVNGGFEVRVQKLTTVPEANSIANAGDNIYMTFSDVMDISQIHLVIFVAGSQSGIISGSWSQQGRTVIFDPTNDFEEGETISVVWTDHSNVNLLVGQNGFWKPGSVYNWQFHVFERWTAIPDPAFEAALEDANATLKNDGRTGFVRTRHIETMTSLDVSNKGISDLTGIGGFSSLTNLQCNYNQLTSLDISANTALIQLDCSGNQLTSLDLSNNLSLTQLSCTHNSLTSLNITNNTSLALLTCRYNNLVSLDVSNNTSLTTLSATNNSLSCIKVNATQDANPPAGWESDAFTVYATDCNNFPRTHIPDFAFEQKLISLKLDNTVDQYVNTESISQVTFLSIDFSNISDLTGIEDFTALTTLRCTDNNLTSLDLSNNTNLINLWCHGNQLTNVNVSASASLTVLVAYSNSLTSLDVSNNPSLTSLDVRGNSGLSCIQVNSTQLANPPVGWIKDASMSYALNCGSSGGRTIEGNLSVLDEQRAVEKKQINIFPNPSAGTFTITTVFELESIEVLDLSGKFVESFHPAGNSYHLDMSNHKAGVYMLRLIGKEGGIDTRMIVKE